MRRVLILYYSQSGEVAAIVNVFADGLRANAEIVSLPIVPFADYPYPWRSVRRFFDAMPESVLGRPPAVAPLPAEARGRFDLVVIAWPVWFLSPALAVQGFFRSADAGLLRGVDAVTITVSRAMWQQGSERMKALLAGAGAVHRDNIVVTHQGSPIATLVSTPRALLSGRRDRLMGVFPEAGVARGDHARIRALGALLGERLEAGVPEGTPFLRGAPAVAVKRWLIVPERLARACFHGAAVSVSGLGRAGPVPRAIGVYGFAVFLVLLILVGLPLTLAVAWLLDPFIRRQLDAWQVRLAEPTGAMDD